MILIHGLIVCDNNCLNLIKDVIAFKLSESQKKTVLIAAVIFSSCAVIYMVYPRYFKAKSLEKEKMEFESEVEFHEMSHVKMEEEKDHDIPLQFTVKEFERVASGKRSIAQRLEDNRKEAAEQQLQELDKGYRIDSGPAQTCYASQCWDENNSIIQVKEALMDRMPTGIASTQGGYRPTMEDADIATHACFKVDGKNCSFDLWGVFDGHGGVNASSFVEKNIVAYLKKELEECNSSTLTQEGVFSAIKKCFIKLDEDYTNNDGTTATVAIRLAGKIFVANVGDSRTILIDKQGIVVQATEDAKPSMQKYIDKIIKLGGFVFPWKGAFRVNGVLAVARAIGDKEVVGDSGRCCISPNPKITCYSEEDFKGGHMVLVCDGVTDVGSSNEIGKGIYEMAQRNESVQDMSTKIVYHALQNGSKDNITAVVVKL